jgi:TraY domain
MPRTTFVGFRSPLVLKLRLEEAARTNGRSLSTEAQCRLERSFHDDETLFRLRPDMDQHFDRVVRQMYESCARYLRDSGAVPEGPLIKAARAVVWARHYRGSDAWDRLKEAIGALEDIVGRPADEADI